MYSKKIRFPAFGAFGRISSAATSDNSFLQLIKVTPIEHMMETISENAKTPASNTYSMAATSYMVL